ncbi:MAG: hypothetical protein QNJ97_16985 [Myxococcota bacterium]|nr:hypothetical protein [Myxococcota bacterium]
MAAAHAHMQCAEVPKAVIALICVASGFMLACDPVDGTDPYALWETFEGAQASYRFRYLSPPWEDISPSDTTEWLLVVNPRAPAFNPAGLPGDGIRGQMILGVRTVGDGDAYDAAEADLAKWSEAQEVFFAETAQPFTNLKGDEGFRVSARSEDRYLTAAYWDLDGDNIGVMTIVGKHDLDTADIALLLRSFEPKERASAW